MIQIILNFVQITSIEDGCILKIIGHCNRYYWIGIGIIENNVIKND